MPPRVTTAKSRAKKASRDERRHFVHFEVPMWLHRYLREVAFRRGTSISRVVQKALFLWLWFNGELPQGREVPDYAMEDIQKLEAIMRLYEISQELKGATRELREMTSLLRSSILELKAVGPQLAPPSGQPPAGEGVSALLPDFVVGNPWIAALASRNEELPRA